MEFGQAIRGRRAMRALPRIAYPNSRFLFIDLSETGFPGTTGRFRDRFSRVQHPFPDLAQSPEGAAGILTSGGDGSQASGADIVH
jgi:hypothetical protein